MRNNGFIIRHLWDQTEEHLEVRALSMEESCALSLAPEVIFICVKEYSLDSVLPFIRQTAGPRTIIIPILNIYGTGARVQKELPDCTVLDGCIYVSASLEHPGVLFSNLPILGLSSIHRDRFLYFSDFISHSIGSLRKRYRWSFIHPYPKGCFGRNFPMSPLSELLESTFMPWPEIFKGGYAQNELFKSMIREISALAAPWISLEKDYVKINGDSFQLICRCHHFHAA